MQLPSQPQSTTTGPWPLLIYRPTHSSGLSWHKWLVHGRYITKTVYP